MSVAPALRSHPLCARLRTRPLAWPRLPWYLEVLSLGIGYFVYSLIRLKAPHAVYPAFGHAYQVFHVEKALHIDVELSTNTWLTRHRTVGLVASYWYSTLHFILTPVLLGFLWVRRRHLYAVLRSGIVVATGMALVVYATWPLAPPRFYVSGTVDTVTRQPVLWDSGHGVQGLVNYYAAMPSLHVGWAFWCAVAVVMAFRTRWRHLAWLYPVGTMLVVLSTANHYLLDGVAGVLVIVLALRLSGVRVLPWHVAEIPVAVREREPLSIG